MLTFVPGEYKVSILLYSSTGRWHRARILAWALEKRLSVNVSTQQRVRYSEGTVPRNLVWTLPKNSLTGKPAYILHLKRDGIIDRNNVALLSLKIPIGCYTEEGGKSANSIFNDVWYVDENFCAGDGKREGQFLYYNAMARRHWVTDCLISETKFADD